MTFKINARNIGLTYSNINQQCPNGDFTREGLQTFLLGSNLAKYVLTARELHQDGNTHFHCLIKLTKKHQLYNQAIYDYLGAHPSIEGIRNLPAWTNYCKKDGDWIESEETNGQQQSSLDHYEVCRGMATEELWVNHCLNSRPIIQFTYCQHIWKSCHGSRITTILPEATINGVIGSQLLNFRFEFKKTLVLIGPAGCGKTTWAKTHLPRPILFVRHLDTLKDFEIGYHKSIIFDDMDFKHIPRSAQIDLVDYENIQQVHLRYRVALIPPGTPKAFTCNYYPFSPAVDSEDKALERRIQVYTIKEFI